MLGILWLIQHWLSRRLSAKSSYNSVSHSKKKSANNSNSQLNINNGAADGENYSSRPRPSFSCSSPEDSSDEYVIPEQLRIEFDSACAFVKTVHDKLGSATLLQLYACFKQANDGPCSQPQPSWYEASACKKWHAWNELGDATSTRAMQQYINTVQQLDLGWDVSAPAKATEGFGLRPSRMLMEEGYVDEDGQMVIEDSEWFAAVKSGDPVLLKPLMVTHHVDETDQNGMSALHWACDRGHCTLVAMLLQQGIDYDLVDDCRQSALHYAASCDYEDIVRLLVAAGANTQLRDSEDLTPLDMATDDRVRQLLM